MLFIGSSFSSTHGIKHVGRRLCSAGLGQVFSGRAPVNGIQGLPVDSYDGWFGGRIAHIILTSLPKMGGGGGRWLPASCRICVPAPVCAVAH